MSSGGMKGGQAGARAFEKHSIYFIT